MSQSKGTLRSIIDLPVATVGSVLNAESDWIRYGLPALILTVIFFFAMRHDSAPVGGAASFQSPINHRSGSAIPPNSFAPNLTMTVPGAGASAPGQQAAAPNLPNAQGITPQQLEARRALCTAARPASNMPAIRRKSTVLRYAVSGYKGSGGFQTAVRIVNEQLADYSAGKWSEDDCPASPDGVRIAKGAIGQALR
jgi:hypothetical protein